MKRYNLNTAVIGVGNMGQHHARIFSKLSNLLAVVDPNMKRGEIIAHKYRCQWFPTINHLLNQNLHLDAVSIVVPTKEHFKIAKIALTHNLPCLIEKPFAQTIDQAEQILSTAKKNGVLITIGYIERFNPAVTHLKKFIDQGIFGKIDTIIARRIGMSPPDTEGLDVARELGSHDIDIINFLIKSEPFKTTIISNKVNNKSYSDTATIILRYPQTTGIVHTNWLTPIKRRMLYVTGTKNSAEINLIKQQIIFYKHTNVIPAYIDYIGLKKIFVDPETIVYKYKSEPLVEEINAFLKQIRNHIYDYSIAESALTILKITNKQINLSRYDS